MIPQKKKTEKLKTNEKIPCLIFLFCTLCETKFLYKIICVIADRRAIFLYLIQLFFTLCNLKKTNNIRFKKLSSILIEMYYLVRFDR